MTETIKAGRNAFKTGKKKESNPYMRGTPKFKEWLMGYLIEQGESRLKSYLVNNR